MQITFDKQTDTITVMFNNKMNRLHKSYFKASDISRLSGFFTRYNVDEDAISYGYSMTDEVKDIVEKAMEVSVVFRKLKKSS